MNNQGHTLQDAIADLAAHGCDLTDPGIDDLDRTEDAAFYLGYLEEICGTPLSLDEVIAGARAMMKDAGPGGDDRRLLN